ncbi:MAG: hypothetical protein ACP5N9_04450 [Candidatus Bilamarchaeum sp.]
MDKTIVLSMFILLIGVESASPTCPSYPYHDYVDASVYHSPEKPSDNLLSSCNLNPNPICLFSNLLNTTEDKQLFIAEDLAKNSFQNISNWNSNISFGKWFNNTKSSVNIKDVWVSIVYIDPSVYDNGTYILNATSKLIVKSNFTFVVDKKKLGGDCKDNYRICGYDYSIDTTNLSTSINSTLLINSEYLVDRYEWVTHCDITGCWVTCDYYATDTFKDSLKTSDSKNISYENLTLNSNYSILKSYNGLAEVNLSINNSNLELIFGNSSYHKSNYTYRTRIELEPYDVLVKEVVHSNINEIYGASILDKNATYSHLLFPQAANCSLTVFGYFTQLSISNCTYPNETSFVVLNKIESTTPDFIQKIENLPFLVLAIYIPIQIAKKVISNA